MHVAREMLGACIYAERYYASSSRTVIEVVSQKVYDNTIGIFLFMLLFTKLAAAVYGKEE